MGPLYSCHGNKIYVGSTRIEKLEAIVTPPSKNWQLIYHDVQESLLQSSAAQENAKQVGATLSSSWELDLKERTLTRLLSRSET